MWKPLSLCVNVDFINCTGFLCSVGVFLFFYSTNVPVEGRAGKPWCCAQLEGCIDLGSWALGEERAQTWLSKELGYKLHGFPNLPASQTYWDVNGLTHLANSTLIHGVLALLPKSCQLQLLYNSKWFNPLQFTREKKHLLHLDPVMSPVKYGSKNSLSSVVWATLVHIKLIFTARRKCKYKISAKHFNSIFSGLTEISNSISHRNKI